MAVTPPNPTTWPQPRPAAPDPLRRALTIVEVVVVLVVLSILSAIAVPRFAGFSANQRLEAAVNRVRADLALAQRLARYSSTSQTVRFYISSNRYSLVNLPSPDHASGSYAVPLGEDPYRVQIAGADFGGDAILVFNGYGEPDSDGSVTLKTGNRTRTISLQSGTGLTIQEMVTIN